MLVILLVFFAGVISGFFLALVGASNLELRQLLMECFGHLAITYSERSFISVVFDCFAWPATAAVVSFFPCGTIAILGIIGLRGFLLSYAVALISLAVPGKGIMISLTLFAVVIGMVVPVLFLWGHEGTRISHARKTRTVIGATSACFRIEVLLVGVGVLIVAVAVQWALEPILLRSICSYLF